MKKFVLTLAGILFSILYSTFSYGELLPDDVELSTHLEGKIVFWLKRGLSYSLAVTSTRFDSSKVIYFNFKEFDQVVLEDNENLHGSCQLAFMKKAMEDWPELVPMDDPYPIRSVQEIKDINDSTTVQFSFLGKDQRGEELEVTVLCSSEMGRSITLRDVRDAFGDYAVIDSPEVVEQRRALAGRKKELDGLADRDI